jgi:hypothetical protein
VGQALCFFYLLFCFLSRRKVLGAKPKQAGKKEGGWGEFRFFFAKSNCGQPRHLSEYLEGRTRRKILFSLKEEKIGHAQNEKSKEYFAVVW